MIKANRRWALIAVSLAALTALVLAMWATQKPARAAFPGENGRIAFSASSSTKGSEIYTMLPDGSDRRQLTSDTGSAVRPAWTADGTKIAFNNRGQGTVVHEIFSMNADGSGLMQLTPVDNDGNPNNHPVWSPDGTKIAFQRQSANGRNSDIWVMNASDGTGQVNLTPNSPSSLDTDPDWSPEGTKLVFSSSDEELYTVNAAGSPRSPLTNTPEVAEYEPAWSPDGKEIVFTRSDQNGIDIWKMRADGTSETNLTDTPEIAESAGDWQPLPGTTTPRNKADCKKGDYREFGFENQGRCIAFVNGASQKERSR
jgi:TolB protein